MELCLALLQEGFKGFNVWMQTGKSEAFLTSLLLVFLLLGQQASHVFSDVSQQIP